ncbi:MAG: hypothetical protein JNK63_09805 [Chthonomonas sp.]|nr:hypothetical protein [Chthonomonas sp.]
MKSFELDAWNEWTVTFPRLRNRGVKNRRYIAYHAETTKDAALVAEDYSDGHINAEHVLAAVAFEGGERELDEPMEGK